MNPTRLRQRPIAMVVAMLIAILAVRALIGDEVSGFVDGMIVGFTDTV